MMLPAPKVESMMMKFLVDFCFWACLRWFRICVGMTGVCVFVVVCVLGCGGGCVIGFVLGFCFGVLFWGFVFWLGFCVVFCCGCVLVLLWLGCDFIESVPGAFEFFGGVIFADGVDEFLVIFLGVEGEMGCHADEGEFIFELEVLGPIFWDLDSSVGVDGEQSCFAGDQGHGVGGVVGEQA